MTTYTAIPDADIDPDKPIKSSTAYAFRDNLLAVIEGDATAPKITSRTISPGGSQADGACTNATSFPGAGFYDFSTLTISSPKTLPFATFIRIDGNATLSSVLTAARTFASATSEGSQIAALGGLTKLGLRALSLLRYTCKAWGASPSGVSTSRPICLTFKGSVLKSGSSLRRFASKEDRFFAILQWAGCPASAAPHALTQAATLAVSTTTIGAVFIFTSRWITRRCNK